MEPTTYPRREVWMEYDCPNGADNDLHDDALVYKGQRFTCAICGNEHTAGVDVEIGVGVDVLIAPREYDYSQRQFVDLPESAEALRALTMETVSYQRISDAVPTNIITACDEHDTCPGCGAGYKVGMSQCEYCKRPVRYATGGMKLIHPGEMAMPASISAYYRRLYDESGLSVGTKSHETPESQHHPHPEHQQGANA